MDSKDLMDKFPEASTGQVFGDPVESDGAILLPCAAVRGGAGGGGGPSGDRSRDQEGFGGGYGLIARPVGAYVIRGGEVTWHPAMDTTRVVAGGQLIGLVSVLAIWSLVRRFLKRRHS